MVICHALRDSKYLEEATLLCTSTAVRTGCARCLVLDVWVLDVWVLDLFVPDVWRPLIWTLNALLLMICACQLPALLPVSFE